ncbi:MAG TPA: hypothetical protein VN228_07305 [Pyrinomonadaceae bacterium]|nr:hypothetical protein [Pyrinomonadaceae bacterium]
MPHTPASNLRRAAAGASLIAGPALLLTSSVARFAFGLLDAWYQTMKLSFFFFAVGALGLVHLLRGRADGSGHAGGALTLAGCLSGASIVTAAYINERLSGAVPLERLEGLYLTIVNSPLPGLFFPIGLLVLAVALTRKKVIPAWAGLLFAAGAVLFPVGRIPGLVWAIFACDVLLTISLGYAGARVLAMTADEWERAPAAAAAEPAAVETLAG